MKALSINLAFLLAILVAASCNQDDEALPGPEPPPPGEIPVEDLLEAPIAVELNP